jgi:ABC-2 type transport system permease protein
MRLKVIRAILKKDFLDSSKNYQIVLMVLTPIILSLLFSNVITGVKSKTSLPEIGVISDSRQPLITTLTDKGMGGKIKFFKNRKELESAVLEGNVSFGLILPDLISSRTDFSEGLAVILLYPPQFNEFSIESIKSAFEGEIRKHLKLQAPPLPFTFVAEPVSGSNNESGAMSANMFPMLLVMSMGMIGFLALPMAIVEEREKGTLNAIFLTPLTTSEFILGKSLFSFLLASMTIGIILTINGKWGTNIPCLLFFIGSGILMVIFIGLVISLFAQTQASVNAIGTTLFLFFQIVPSLQKTSDVMKQVAPFIPSSYLFSGLKKALFLDLNKVDIYSDIYTVAGLTIFAYIICFVSFKLKKADK